MIRITEGEPVAQFVARQCGIDGFADPYRAIGYTLDGAILGGAVFNGYTSRNVDLSIGHEARSWPVPFVRYFGDYIWETLGVSRVTMIVRPELSPLCKRMGAEFEGILRKWYPDGDAALFGLLREDWSFKK